jgi:hypothetical protein
LILSELRASAYKIAAAVFGVLAGALLIGCFLLWNRATRANVRADAESARAEASEARAKALSDVIDTERESARRANEIAAKYERDKIDAEANAKRVADDLRAGNLRLRSLWEGCNAERVPETGSAPGQPDAASDDRAESASRIVRAAEEADAQITALQSFIREALK